VCSKCHNVQYCNKQCQLKHWPNGLFGPMSDVQRDVATVSFHTNSQASRSVKHKSDPAKCFVAMNCAFKLALLYQMCNKWGECLGFMHDFDDFFWAYKLLVLEGSDKWLDAGASALVSCIANNMKLVEAVVFSDKNKSGVKRVHAVPAGSASNMCKYALAQDLLLQQTTWCAPGDSVAVNIDRILSLGVIYLFVIHGSINNGEYGEAFRKDIMLSQQIIQRTLAIMRSEDVPEEYKSRARHLKFFLSQEKNFVIAELVMALKDQHSA